MSRKYILLGVLLLFAVPAWAQDDVEKVNVFVGYSYLRGTLAGCTVALLAAA